MFARLKDFIRRHHDSALFFCIVQFVIIVIASFVAAYMSAYIGLLIYACFVIGLFWWKTLRRHREPNFRWDAYEVAEVVALAFAILCLVIFLLIPYLSKTLRAVIGIMLFVSTIAYECLNYVNRGK